MLLSKTNKKFSKLTKDGSCPRCHGTSFKAKRSLGGKVGFGLLAPKSRVRCETCGYEMRRA